MQRNSILLTLFFITTPVLAQTVHTIDQTHWLLTSFTFYGLGILLAFTPCVLPMIPILAGILLAQEKPSTFRALQIALAFVLGMAVTYAIAGASAGYLGSTIQTTLQKPWLIASFSMIFVIMAFSMFGWFDIRLPQRLSNHINRLSNKIALRNLVNVAVLGMLSTLIASPCVTAPMLSVLTFISQTGNALIGAWLLFILALGMGTPLILFAIGQGALLPKTGVWMNQIKALFGVIMLGVAIWMVARILPGNIALLLWAALIIVSAISFGALDFNHQNSQGRFKQGITFLALSYGIILLIGASSGHDDFLQPLQSTTLASNNQKSNTIRQLFSYATDAASLERTLQLAKAKHLPVMIEFYASWCPDCRALDRKVFSDPTIQELMQAFVTIRVDSTLDNDELKALRARYHVYGVPTLVFYNKQGEEIKADRDQEPSYEFVKNKLTELA